MGFVAESKTSRPVVRMGLPLSRR
ncbi:MAG: hypothetical protein RJA16_1388, partial [Planctomycetota bacterium]